MKNAPLLLLAYVIGIPLGIAAFLWGVGQIIVAVGTASALVIGMFSAGAALGDVVEVWAIRTAAIALGVGGATVAFKVVVNITQQVKNDAYAWALPIIAILVGLIVEIDKEFYEASPIFKHFISAVFAFVMLVGGYLFTKKGKVPKISAIILMFSPPSIILTSIISSADANNVKQAFLSVGFLQWVTIIGIVSLAAVLAILSTTMNKSS